MNEGMVTLIQYHNPSVAAQIAQIAQIADRSWAKSQILSKKNRPLCSKGLDFHVCLRNFRFWVWGTCCCWRVMMVQFEISVQYAHRQHHMCIDSIFTLEHQLR